MSTMVPAAAHTGVNTTALVVLILLFLLVTGMGFWATRWLALAVSITGILATMPYIALQLVGIQAVLEVAGVGGSNALAKDLPLFIAFALLAAYTYSSGLRAPAMIAFVKDALIYLVIIVAVIYLPSKVGGWDHVFSAAEAKMAKPS